MSHIERFHKLKQELNEMKIQHDQVWHRYSMGQVKYENCKYLLEKATERVNMAQRKEQVARYKLEDAKMLLDYKQKLYTDIKLHIKGLNTELKTIKEEMKEFIPTTEEENKFKRELTDTDICKISDDESSKKNEEVEINLSDTDEEDNEDD